LSIGIAERDGRVIVSARISRHPIDGRRTRSWVRTKAPGGAAIGARPIQSMG